MSKPDGTPDGAVDDAAVESGTPGGTQDGGGEDENKGKLIATLQEKASKVNALEKEKAELQAELERIRAGQSPGSGQPSPAATDPERLDPDMVRRAYMAIQDAAKQGDPYAIMQLESARALYERQRALEDEIERSRIPDAEREGVEKLYQTGNYRTREAARLAWRGSLTDDEREKYFPPKRSTPAREREEVVDTATRPLSAVGLQQREYGRSEWTREWDKAAAAGDAKKMDELRRSIPRR